MFPDLHLAFSLILKIGSRLLHPYSTDVKTSRLMVKQFSTARDTQRGSQSYIKKRRGRKEIEVTRRRRGKIPWRRAWQPTPVFLPGKSHRQRSLVYKGIVMENVNNRDR